MSRIGGKTSATVVKVPSVIMKSRNSNLSEDIPLSSLAIPHGRRICYNNKYIQPTSQGALVLVALVALSAHANDSMAKSIP